MASYSIKDVLLSLKQECAVLEENWQGETANVYMDKVMNHYISYVNAIEKCLQGINQGLDEVSSSLEDDTDSIYEHSPKKL